MDDHSVDTATGEILECHRCRLRNEKIFMLEEKVEVLKEEIAYKAMQLGKLKKQLEDKQKADAYRKEADAIFDFWKWAMAKRDHTSFNRKRRQEVLGRLKDGYPMEDIRDAIRWVAIRPCVENKERVAFRKDLKRYDDLALICRDDRIEFFRDSWRAFSRAGGDLSA